MVAVHDIGFNGHGFRLRLIKANYAHIFEYSRVSMWLRHHTFGYFIVTVINTFQMITQHLDSRTLPRMDNSPRPLYGLNFQKAMATLGPKIKLKN